MALEQSEAIVLRIYPWSETSCIASVYTREHGKLSLLAKGAKRAKSPFEAALDLLSICRVVFISKSSDALDILTEASLERRFRAARFNFLRLNCGYYVAELLDRFTEKGERQPEVYDLAKTTLGDLEQENLDPRGIVLRFELQLLRMLGHLPSWNACVHCGEVNPPPGGWILFSSNSGGVLCANCQVQARQLMRIHTSVQQTLSRFSAADWEAIRLEDYPADHRSAIRKLVVRYLTTLLDRPFHLHAYLEELGR